MTFFAKPSPRDHGWRHRHRGSCSSTLPSRAPWQ